MKQRLLVFCAFACILFVPTVSLVAQRALLTPEEELWLSSRNRTIVVYPEKNNPPFSYENPSGAIAGLSIDYIELIAEKIGAQLHYTTARSRSQIITDSKEGRGDVLLSLTPTKEREETLLFTESFTTVPVVIVVRKDAALKKVMSPSDFNGKRIAVIDGSAAEEFLRENYPRVILDTVTDDEVGLQQTVLGEVDGAVMDVASLSFLLAKQVLNSVKVAGNAGLEYEFSFAVPKGKEPLQAILEKGLSQISTREREMLAEKWATLPGDMARAGSGWGTGARMSTLEIVLAIGLGVMVICFIISLHRKRFLRRVFKKERTISELRGEINDLAATSEVLEKELETVHRLEETIEEKLKKLEQ